jgi:hypothetical protein
VQAADRQRHGNVTTTAEQRQPQITQIHADKSHGNNGTATSTVPDKSDFECTFVPLSALICGICG